MAKRGTTGKSASRQAHDEIVGPEIGAEKAEEKTFDESRREGRIVSGVRTRIDRRK